MQMKELQNKLEMIEIQEDYIKTELNHLKSEEARSKEEVSLTFYRLGIVWLQMGSKIRCPLMQQINQTFVRSQTYLMTNSFFFSLS